jgi:hypothetical protein
MDECEYIDECRNAGNDAKCNKCEHNPANFEKLERDDQRETARKTKAFYIFRDNYDPL